MGKRERKRKADKPKKKGIPVAELGSGFEWIDERLKVGLEAYPSWKRPISKAEMSMMIALNLYYDEITGKWQPLDSLSISTVQNQGRFYLSPPSALVADQWANLRVDNEQKLLVKDDYAKDKIYGVTYTGLVAPVSELWIDVELPTDSLIGTISLYLTVTGAASWWYEIYAVQPSPASNMLLLSVNPAGAKTYALSWNIPPNRKFRVHLLTGADNNIVYNLNAVDGAYGITNLNKTA